MQGTFMRQQAEILRRLEEWDEEDIEDVIFDQEKERSRVAVALAAILGLLLMQGAEIGAETIHVTEPLDMTRPFVRDFIEQYPFRFANKLNGTTANRVREALREGITKNESVEELKTRLMTIPEFADRGETYAELVARTESWRAERTGERLMWQQSGKVAAHIWKCMEDACDFCAALDGMITSIDTPFFEVGESLDLPDGRTLLFDYEDIDGPPAHPWCRCITLPVEMEI